MLLILELKTNSMMNLLAQGRTKEKGTMARKKSSVHIAGRASTLNMPAWKRNLMKLPLSLREITSIFQKAFGGEISKIGNHNMKKVMPSWQALRSPKHSWLILELRTTWWMKETPFHPWRPENPSPSTWEMTPPSFQKDKVRLILRMAIFQMFCMYHLWHQISLVSIRWHIQECLRYFLSAQIYVEIMELASGKLIAKGLENHHARSYEFSHFVPDAKPTTLLTHGNEVSRLWHERFGNINFKYLQQLQKHSMVEGQSPPLS